MAHGVYSADWLYKLCKFYLLQWYHQQFVVNFAAVNTKYQNDAVFLIETFCSYVQICYWPQSFRFLQYLQCWTLLIIVLFSVWLIVSLSDINIIHVRSLFHNTGQLKGTRHTLKQLFYCTGSVGWIMSCLSLESQIFKTLKNYSMQLINLFFWCCQATGKIMSLTSVDITVMPSRFSTEGDTWVNRTFHRSLLQADTCHCWGWCWVLVQYMYHNWRSRCVSVVLLCGWLVGYEFASHWQD